MITKEQYDDIMARREVTNEEISAAEVYQFINDPPDKYFVYINEERHEATTWIGEKLGHVTGLSQIPKRSNFGDFRVYIDVYGINGKKYHGVYYKSAGDYARIKMYKHQDK